MITSASQVVSLGASDAHFHIVASGKQLRKETFLNSIASDLDNRAEAGYCAVGREGNILKAKVFFPYIISSDMQIYQTAE